MAEKVEQEMERGFGATYMRGLHTSTRGNAPAYGYSVTITASFGILSAVTGAPTVSEIFVFAGGAVVAFAVIGAIASGGFGHSLADEPSEVRALGGSISVFSVGGALCAALIAGLPGGFFSWLLGAFLATLVYLSAFALEISVAERLRPRDRQGGR